jgi:hypothetical protein
LVALHHRLTQINLPHGTPLFQGIDAPEALVEDESVAVDTRARVQVADGQVFVYGADGAALRHR